MRAPSLQGDRTTRDLHCKRVAAALVRGIAPPLSGGYRETTVAAAERENWVLSGKRTNTTALIVNWSMAGALDDLNGRFESAVDIDAVVAERDRESYDEVAPPARAPLLLKPAGEDEWHPLVVAAEPA
jgi:hypothetical protein